MHRDPFVMHSVERARRWVELCSEGMGILPEDSAQVLAGLCGFGSWDVMAYGIESLPPSIPDERLAPAQFLDRLLGQMAILLDQFDFETPAATRLLRNLSPSSNRPFTQFEAEASDHPASAQVELLRSKLFETFELLSSDDVDEEDAEVEAFLPPIDPEREETAAVLCRDPRAINWMGIFGCLGWEGALKDDAPGIDQPAYLIQDATLGTVPVYVAPAVYPPDMDDDDLMFPVRRLLRTISVGDLTASDQYAGVALLLLQWPLVKEVDGQVYCHLGSAYVAAENKWVDLLFNMACTSVCELLDLNSQVTDINQGAECLADTGRQFSNLATLFLSGLSLDEYEDISEEFEIIPVLFDETGWVLQRIELPAELRWPEETED
jgi:hypothetical protein